MSTQLISYDFGDQFNEILESTTQEIFIISPFIGLKTASQLADWLKQNPTVICRIITRFYREDFIQNVSSLQGLEELYKAGAALYAVQGLHTKLYLFDDHSVIIGSANFTNGGFYSNIELSVLFQDEEEIYIAGKNYFSDLLSLVQDSKDAIITEEWITEEKLQVSKMRANQKGKTVTYAPNRFKRGYIVPRQKTTDLLEECLENATDKSNIGTNFWLKFEGTGEERVNHDWDYTQLKGKRNRALEKTHFPRRPGSIEKDHTLFIAIVSYDKEKNPTPMIIGYAGTDGFNNKNVISESEKTAEPWKERFPYFLELYDGKVIKGPIKNGIPLQDVYRDLGKRTYPTLMNKENVKPITLNSMHFKRSHLRITNEASDYLVKRLEQLFKTEGYMTIGDGVPKKVGI
jgi:HKD family nuclease